MESIKFAQPNLAWNLWMDCDCLLIELGSHDVTQCVALKSTPDQACVPMDIL